MPKVHQPKFREKLFFFISGIIISTPFPILVDSLINRSLNAKLPAFYAFLFTAAIFAPIVEEFAKAYPLFYRHGENEKSIMALGFWTGLGFGIAEFFLYVFVLHASIIYRLPALLFHATNTTIVAYGIAKNKPLRFYFLAVGLHFLNNFSALFGSAWLIGGIGATLASYILAWYFYRRTKEKTIDFWTQTSTSR